MEESGGDSSNMARTLDPIEMPPADCANLPRRLLAPLSRLVMVWTTLDTFRTDLSFFHSVLLYILTDIIPEYTQEFNFFIGENAKLITHIAQLTSCNTTTIDPIIKPRSDSDSAQKTALEVIFVRLLVCRRQSIAIANSIGELVRSKLLLFRVTGIVQKSIFSQIRGKRKYRKYGN